MRMASGELVSLATAAGLLAVLAGLGVSRVRGDESGAQEKSTAAKAVPPEKKPAPPKPRIAVFRLAGDLTQLPPDETFSFGAVGGTSLRDLIERMKKAGEDSNVKAVVFLHEGGSVGAGQAEEIRAAMAKLRAAGKEIYAHADSLSMREYVLLSGSRLSVVPTADLWVIGLFGESPYLAASSTRSASSRISSPAATRARRRSSCAKDRAPRPRRCRTGCSTAFRHAPLR